MPITMNPYSRVQRRLRPAIILLFLFCAAACSAETPESTVVASSSAAATLPAATIPGPSATPQPAGMAGTTPTIAPSPTLTAPATSNAPSTTPTQTGYQVIVHPDNGLYSGDQVSFEVIAPKGAAVDGKTIEATLPTQDGEKKASAKFARYGIGARMEAVLLWAWDTRELPAGEYPVTFSLPPDGPSWTETIRLEPRSQLPPPEPEARWVTERSECCVVHAISGTEGQRDLPRLLDLIDQQAEKAVDHMDVNLDKPITIVLLPRVLGHGGFAGQEIAISYLDRNYMGSHPEIVLHHEMIHILDGRLGGDYRPSALVEGLAVYQSGGHFKPEPLAERTAALLPPEPGCLPWQPGAGQAAAAGKPNGDSAVVHRGPTANQNTPTSQPASPEGCGVDQYIPLRTLFDNFYFQQHEVGYLEAAGLIQYMVETWGYQAFNAFYRDIQPPAQSNGKPSQTVDAALKKHFDIRLDQLESQFKAYLRQKTVTPAIAEDLRLSLDFFDTSRRYQQELDPSAYFLTAWLVDNEQMRNKDIVADYVRHPSRPENLALETMLRAADEALSQGDYVQAGRLLEASDTVLEAYPTRGLQAFDAHPVAADYLSLVQTALAAGYEPQRIRLENETARLWGNQNGPQLRLLTYTRQTSGWSLASIN